MRKQQYFGFALMVAIAMSGLGCATPQAETRSAIFFIGDGMGFAQVTAARIYQGNARDGRLALDSFEHVALVRTHSANRMVTDSAAAATALASGVKTLSGRVGMDVEANVLETILEKAKRAGKSVGVVTTTSVSHATPACFYAHVPERHDEVGICAQLIERADVDIVMGGGREYFIPDSETDGETGRPGSRSDGRDLLKEAEAAGYRVIHRQSEFDALRDEVEAGGEPGMILALFDYGMMTYEYERADDAWGEPSLSEMAALAIEVLSRNPKGFFLMVEGGRIDHACHSNIAHAAVLEMLEFDRAIALGAEFARKDGETLVIVTADHETGGLAINGYPALELSGDAIFSDQSLPGGGEILTFATGPGFDRTRPYATGENGELPEGELTPASPAYRSPSGRHWRSASHTGVDVGAWATGSASEAVHGTMENNELAHIIIEALGLD